MRAGAAFGNELGSALRRGTFGLPGDGERNGRIHEEKRSVAIRMSAMMAKLVRYPTPATGGIEEIVCCRAWIVRSLSSQLTKAIVRFAQGRNKADVASLRGARQYPSYRLKVE